MAKAPLWVIAFSLLTIACCLVLLVMRTVFGDKAQVSAANTATSSREANPALETETPEPTVYHHESLIVHREATPSANPANPGQPGGEAPVETVSAERSPMLLAVNTRRPAVSPVVLYQTDYQNGIKGTVRLLGEPPAEISVDTAGTPCSPVGAAPTTTRFFVTDTNGALADTLVFIADKLDNQVFPVPDEPFEFVFTNCLIEPYVSAVISKERVLARDGTGMRHDLRMTSSGGSSDHRMISADSTAALPELKPDLFTRISCDIHPWEFAYVSAFKHPFFAVTDEHGRFSITNIPPGGYTIQAMHRSGQNRGFGQAQKKVKVSPKEMTSVDFEISTRAK